MPPASGMLSGAIGVVIVFSTGATFADDLPAPPRAFAGRYEALHSRKPACSLVIEERGGYSLTCPLPPEVSGHAMLWRDQIGFGWQVLPADWMRVPLEWTRPSTEEIAADQFRWEHFADHRFYPLVFPPKPRLPQTMLPLAPVRFGKDLYLVGDEERDAFCARVQKGKRPARSDLPNRLFVARGWKGDAPVLGPTAYCAVDWKPRSPFE